MEQMGATSYDLGSPQGFVLEGRPRPLPSLKIGLIFLLLLVATFTFALNSPGEGDVWAYAPALGLELALVAGFVGHRLVIQARDRYRVELHARGYTVQRGGTTQVIPYAGLETLVLTEREQLKNGKHLGWLRTVEARTPSARASFSVYSPAGQQDPGVELIGQLVAQAAEAAESRRENGVVLRGSGWTLEAEGLRPRPGAPVVPLSQLSAASRFQDQVSLWRGTEELPFFSTPEDGPNAHLLLALANRFVSENGLAAHSEALSLGRRLFEKSKDPSAMGCLGLMSLVWVALGVWWVVAPPAAMDPGVARGILEWGLLVSAVCAIGFFLLNENRIQFHERGLVRKTLFGSRRVRYAEIQSFRFSEIRHYQDDEYVNTSVSLAFVPQEGERITFGMSIHGQDKDLEFLRTTISRIIAVRLYQRVVEGGEEVQWGPHARLGRRAISVNTSSPGGAAHQRMLAYSTNLRLAIEQGSCTVSMPGESQPALTLPSMEENFYPGLLVFQQLCADVARR